jgi:hypothetical protein
MDDLSVIRACGVVSAELLLGPSLVCIVKILGRPLHQYLHIKVVKYLAQN